MELLDAWARRWQIPPHVLTDLKMRLGVAHTGISPKDKGHSESHVQSLIKIEASRKGARLFRNNVGATVMPDGSFIRYGLANESAAINRVIKSSDLIGIKPVLITIDMVGLTIGQFISREVKHSEWEYTGTDREKAQLRWLELILSFGGDAAFVTGEGSL